jgi:hypothetical protein
MSGGQVVFTLSLLVPLFTGLLVGRWRFLFAVLGVWLGIAIFLRENNGWYGYGWGDGGIAITVGWAVLTFLLAVLGVGLRKASSASRERTAA